MERLHRPLQRTESTSGRWAARRVLWGCSSPPRLLRRCLLLVRPLLRLLPLLRLWHRLRRRRPGLLLRLPLLHTALLHLVRRRPI